MTCTICNDPAVGSFKIDLDIQGIGFCKEHESLVQCGFFFLLQGNLKEAEKILSPKKKKRKKNPSS